jgi:hypothetical protein
MINEEAPIKRRSAQRRAPVVGKAAGATPPAEAAAQPIAKADAATDPGKIAKQAIVVVHGQGQQRPMGTIREFVMSLWQFNPELTLDSPPADKGREYWIVPDGKSGLFELQRITTPPYDERRTDFFELYYADLLENTPLRNLWRWLQRLLFVDKNDIPKKIVPAWKLLWAISFFTAILLIVVVAGIPSLLHTAWTTAFFLSDGETNWAGWIALGLATTGGLARYLPRFSDRFAWLKPVPKWTTSAMIAMGLSLIVALVGAWLVVGALALAGIGYAATNLVLPLFGDAASYLSAQTETVQSRQAVRTRGLDLLRALHDDPGYDRVILIAHSLGTVVAYDLLQLLWEAVGPTKDNPPGADQLHALKKVDLFVATQAGAAIWSPEDVDVYQTLQWGAFNALRQQGPRPKSRTSAARPAGWKVSDFITLGSPLGNATFLVAQGAEEFARLKEERLMPTSPPQPFDIKQNATSFFSTDGLATHHAAVFSAVRWTNIHDPVEPGWRIYRGDFISTRLQGQEMFGNGIKDLEVRITKADGVSRGFTHNDYWRELSGDWNKKSDHVTKLRAAVGMTRS